MNKGFTLVETFVAILIVVAAVVGTTQAIQTGLSSYILSKNQVTAFYLAQEAFEQIRNLRDENALNNRNWLFGISRVSTDPCYFGNYCIVDPVVSPTPNRCSGGAGSCPMLKQDLTTGFFGYNSLWKDTVYKREISLTNVSPTEVAVIVTVDYSKGAITRQFKSKEILTSWQRTEN